MKTKPFFLAIFFLVLSTAKGNTQVNSMKSSIDTDLNVIRQVADNILSNTTYDFIIPDDGTILKSVNASNYKETIALRIP